MEWINKGHLLDKAGETISNYDGAYFIYGAGQLGEVIYSKLKNISKIDGFIDKDIYKTEYLELPVHHIEDISKIEGKIIVSVSRYYDEIKKLLESNGLVEDVDFFSEGFVHIYNLYKRDVVSLNRVDISITNKCTLKCKYCNMFMPHFVNPQDMLLEDIIYSIDNLFDKIDYLYELNLLGGEPFINKDFSKILEHVSKYRKKIEKVTIFSNATILPSQEQIDIIKEHDITIQITDYTTAVNYKKNLDKFVDIVKGNNILNQYFSLDKWSDFGFPHNSSNVTNTKALIKKFDDCCPNFRGLVGNKLYFCHLSLSAEKAGIFDGVESDYFLLDDNFDKNELIEYDLGYNDIGYVSFCTVCRGCYSGIDVDSRIQL